MDLSELCHLIDLPVAMRERVLAFDAGFDYSATDDVTPGLQNRATWDQAVKEMQRILGDDPDGVKMLACMLRCTLQAHQVYVGKGIPETIYRDTFGFFTRFIDFHRAVYGFPGFFRFSSGKSASGLV